MFLKVPAKRKSYTKPTSQLHEVMRDVLATAAQQSNERLMQDLCARHYDNKGLSEETKRILEMHDMPNINPSLIKSSINSVVGTEIKARTDLMVTADRDEHTEAAEAINAELNQATRMTQFNEICSEAHRMQLITGVGWVYVGKNTNPLGYKYVVENVHRSDMIRDQASVRNDRADAKFEGRRRYMAEDDVRGLFPDHGELIDHVFTDWGRWDILPGGSFAETIAGSSSNDARGGSMFIGGGQTNGIRRIAVYELYYRRTEKRTLVHYVAEDRVEAYDSGNPDHLSDVLTGTCVMKSAYVPVMKCAWFIGPYLAEDGDSEHPHNEFPFVLWAGYREDDTNHLVGVVADMIGPEHAYANALVRKHHILNSTTITYEKGALGSIDNPMPRSEIQREMNRKDRQIEYNKGYNRPDVSKDWAELQALDNILAETEEAMRKSSGITNAFIGETGGTTSGTHLAGVVEQAMVTLTPIAAANDNARKRAGSLLMSLILDDIGYRPYEVSIKETAGLARKKVVLNKPNEEGGIDNSLMQANLSLVLDDVTTSQGYREQNYQRTAEMFSSVSDPEVQKQLMPILIEQSNWPGKDRFLADWYRQHGGGGTEEEKAEAAAQQSEAASQLQQLEMAIRQAELELSQAKVDREKAESEEARARAAHYLSQIEQGMDNTRLAEQKQAYDMRTTQVQADQQGAQAAQQSAQDDKEKDKAMMEIRRAMARRQLSQAAGASMAA